jgi:hypothetical protein
MDSPLHDIAGGNFDLRPVLDPKLQLFSHDVPGFYAQWVNILSLQNFNLIWDAVRKPFFTHGIEIENFKGIRIDRFTGSSAPNSPTAFPIMIRNGTGFEIDADRQSIRKENVKN